MYYKLADNLKLRGWQKQPYAVVNTGSGEVFTVDRSVFTVLDMCNGKINFDILPPSEARKELIGQLVRDGAVLISEKADPVPEDAEYRKYENRLIRHAHWSITGKCNYHCRHCFLSAPDALYGELPLKDILAIIDELEKCGIYRVNLTGGEPLVRKDFWEIVDALTEKNIVISTVYTNGALLDVKILDGFAERKLSPAFNMSYDGPDGLHGWLRGTERADADIERAFLLCRERGFRTDAEMCIHDGNIHTLRKTVNTLAGWGCGALKATPVTAIGAWKSNGYERGFSFEHLFDTYLEYIPQYFDDGAPLSLQLGGFFMFDRKTGKAEIPCIKHCTDPSEVCVCGHARNNMYISPEGRALPCIPLGGTEIQKKFPFILEEGLRKCLSDSFYMQTIEMPASSVLEHNEKCHSCRYSHSCLGGCRAAALETEPDDYYAADESTCAFFTGEYHEKLKSLLLKCGIDIS